MKDYWLSQRKIPLKPPGSSNELMDILSSWVQCNIVGLSHILVIVRVGNEMFFVAIYLTTCKQINQRISFAQTLEANRKITL